MKFRFPVLMTILIALTIASSDTIYASPPPVCVEALEYQGTDTQKKIDLFTQCLEMDALFERDSGLAHIKRGSAFHQQGRFDLFLADYKQAITLYKKHTTNHYNRGKSYFALGDYEAALADFEEVKIMAPRMALVYNNLAWVYATCPDRQFVDGEQAVKLALTAVRLSKDDPGHLDTLAAAYAETGQFEKAVEMQTKAVLLAERSGDDVTEFIKPLEAYRSGQKYY